MIEDVHTNNVRYQLNKEKVKRKIRRKMIFGYTTEALQLVLEIYI